eukprot:CCRYP_008110-RA/>CCRYP_008110-RA protein AED:0.15 eAED:0.15 QI:111/1/1/1/0.5/0.33/3/816/468
MSSDDIASQLLHSSDARIAEAAKRVFSSSYPAAASVSRSSSTAPPQFPTYYYSNDSAADDEGGGDIERQQASVISSTKEGQPVNSDHFVKHTVDNGGIHKRAFSSSFELSPSMELAQDVEEEDDRKLSSTERLQRSRERNRMHARKTRQRKKEHMQKLQNRADELKLDQIRLKQAINEKNTASILVGLFQSESFVSDAGGNVAMDPRVETLLKRATEDIPDASKIPELPALILPGQHSNKKKSAEDDMDHVEAAEEAQEDGIDYELLGKDRAICSPAELDKIRRERNRMHAKRTRDRKRIFMEEMEVMIRQLEEENALLQDHVDKINGNMTTSQAVSPDLDPAPISVDVACTASLYSPTQHTYNAEIAKPQPPQFPLSQGQSSKGDFRNQIESLLAAAGAFERQRSVGEINAISCAESDVTASTNNSEHNSLCGEEDEEHCHHSKKQRLLEQDLPISVPSSITTTKLL